MGINLTNFLSSKSKNLKMINYQDLDHLDGLSISVVSANLYGTSRDDLVMFYFRDGANFASVYTKSKILSENIKWNLNQKTKKIFSLLINTRNANSFTGEHGYKSMQNIAEAIALELTQKQKNDEENPITIKPKFILFGCTGTIGEKFPVEKIISQIPDLIKNIKYTQNKHVWMKAALGIMTTDTEPKISMEECQIGKTSVKLYGIAKGSGMIHPNMATTLGYVFTDANLSNEILKKLLQKNIEDTFNAISCDGDTSTNDMVSIFSTGKANHSKILSANDKKLREFDLALNKILLNLAKRVVADGEGANKFITVKVLGSKTDADAKKIAFSIANSPLVKTAIAGEDPNWGRIIMAIGKSEAEINMSKLAVRFGNINVVHKGKLHISYDETKTAEYMKNNDIEICVNVGSGKKSFTAYTMDLTKKYIEINTDYRS